MKHKHKLEKNDARLYLHLKPSTKDELNMIAKEKGMKIGKVGRYLLAMAIDDYIDTFKYEFNFSEEDLELLTDIRAKTNLSLEEITEMIVYLQLTIFRDDSNTIDNFIDMVLELKKEKEARFNNES